MTRGRMELISWTLFGILSVVLPIKADLPAGCTPLNDQVFGTVDPSTIFEANSELQDIIPPLRMGDWRPNYAIPTQHFVINQAKPGMSAARQGPYSVWLESDGVTYDAYTLERWSDPVRSDEMQQQTPSEVGAPWNKVTSLGTNMKQIVSGPEGNPHGTFTGRSGVRIGLTGAGDPTWAGFGEMYGDFLYTDVDGGTMEVPLVRGSAFATHKFTNANPILFPYCLSTVNGVAVPDYSCPSEREISDPGEAFADATCTGGTLTTYLRSTKVLDLEDVQWAVNTLADWPNSHSMSTCGSECQLSPDRLTVSVTYPNSASGTMAYAFNVIGKFVIPSDWTNNPATVACSLREARVGYMPCDADLCHTPSCNGNTFELVIALTDPVASATEVQLAADETSEWSVSTPMMTCADAAAPMACSLSSDGTTITYSNTFTETSISYAINIIGRYVKPPGDWQASPYTYTCGSTTTPGPTTTGPTTTGPTTTGPTTTGPPGTSTTPPGTTTTIPPGSTVAPTYCSDPPPALSPCPSSFCKQTFCEPASGSDQYFKLVIQLSSAIGDIDEVQVAANTGTDWDASHPMVTCTAEKCTLQPDMTTLVYCDTFPSGPVKYAVNIVGQFIQPPEDWETDPFQTQCGGSGVDLGTGTKFVLELDEPGDDLPSQTRKYVIYFPTEVRLISDANGLNFEPTAGGKYTGILQMAYAGSTARGDLSAADFYDQYQGVYSYQPVTTYCVQDGKAYLDYGWNKHDNNGPTTSGELLMISMPHHVTLMPTSTPIDTPFTFKGYPGDFWLLEYDLPSSTLDPDPAGVALVQANSEWNTNVLNGLDIDTQDQDLANACSYKDSYWLGKDIAMVSRLASVSRAFGTTHYQTVDPILKNCLENWLRINDTLADGNKFRYDTVYGGLLLRSAAEGSPIDPGANYGFPVYSDHHFHVGYLIYAMAYYAKYYPAWATTHNDRIRILARDVSSPGTNDVYFPVVRHKDFYIGHSWATGILAGQRQQESSSEAINCYHAIAALGEALGDSVMQQMGQLTLAMEVHSVRQYYHVRDASRANFPPHIQSYGTIGMYGEDTVFLYTLNWPCDPIEYPMRHACLVGIQILPVISVSHMYMDQEWATSVHDVCQWALDPTSAPDAGLVDPAILQPVSIGWGAFCHTILSKYDTAAQTAAADYVKDLSPSQLVSGSGIGSTLLYIYAST